MSCVCWGESGRGRGGWGWRVRREVGGGLERNKVDDEAEIVETWGRRMAEICTYIWESLVVRLWCV